MELRVRQMQLKQILVLIQPAFLQRGGRRDEWVPLDPAVHNLLDTVQALLEQVASRREHGDLLWPPIWLQIEREPWKEIKRELTEEDDYDREAWELDYPYAIEWLSVIFRRSEGNWYVHHDQILASFCYDPVGRQVSGFVTPSDVEVTEALNEYLSWIAGAVTEKLESFFSDPSAYNMFVEANLPNRERMGKIRRRDLWRALPEEQHYLRNELSQEEVNEFVRIAPALVEAKPLISLTRDDYLRFCATCYAGAGYSGVDNLSPLEQYRKFADGRHDGLLDLVGDSPTALADWFASHPRGGHPWEIARGGNTTHISLFLMKQEAGYTLLLDGSARTRAAETIRMALALTRAGIPFQLRDAAYLANMAQGNDWIGIVPRDADSYFASQLFPAVDEVRDILAYPAIAQHANLEQQVQWYPVEPLQKAR